MSTTGSRFDPAEDLDEVLATNLRISNAQLRVREVIFKY